MEPLKQKTVRLSGPRVSAEFAKKLGDAVEYYGYSSAPYFFLACAKTLIGHKENGDSLTRPTALRKFSASPSLTPHVTE
jgi:hypothetical protein